MTISFSIPTENDSITVALEPGGTAVFVGANGAGKTRLAVQVEKSLGANAHRISAHRALVLNPEVPKISEESALRGVSIGSSGPALTLNNRDHFRWKNNAATHLLNDFDFLLQALFAEQGNKALKTHTNARKGEFKGITPTKFELLKEMWERLLPTRTLLLGGGTVLMSALKAPSIQPQK